MSRCGLASMTMSAPSAACTRSMNGRIPVAQLGDVSNRREGGRDVERQRGQHAPGRPPRPGAALDEAGQRRSGQQREHVLDALEHGAGFRRVDAQQRLRDHRQPRVVARARAPGQQGGHDEDRQPDVVDAAVVVEPPLREHQHLGVVVDGARHAGPVLRRARVVDGVVEADVLGIAQRFPVRRQRGHGGQRRRERQAADSAPVAEVGGLDQQEDAGVDGERGMRIERQRQAEEQHRPAPPLAATRGVAAAQRQDDAADADERVGVAARSQRS